MNFEKEINKIIDEKKEEIAKIDSLNSTTYTNEELEATKEVIQSEIDGYERSLEEAKLRIDEFRQNPENEKVLKMLLSVIEYETNLPLIYETLNKLKKQIDEKYERLIYLKEQLIEYQSVLMQIEGLTNED